MAEVEISYKGSNIATMNASGTKTLLTEAKYLEDDVTITYARPSAPSGTKNISITQNGTTTEDVTNYASAQITANVPNTYAAADEGKVVDDGALVAQTSRNIDTNGTYDTTTNNEVVVNVSGGVDDSRWVVRPSTFTSYENNEIASVGQGALAYSTYISHFMAHNATSVGYRAFTQANALTEKLAFPKFTTPGSQFLYDSKVTGIDVAFSAQIPAWYFQNAHSFKYLVLRGDTRIGLANTNAFTYSNVWKNGGTGGVLYVKSSLVSEYTSASNWSTIIGYSNNQIKSIESTHTDPDAPIDLTLYYLDGTPIPTT